MHASALATIAGDPYATEHTGRDATEHATGQTENAEDGDATEHAREDPSANGPLAAPWPEAPQAAYGPPAEECQPDWSCAAWYSLGPFDADRYKQMLMARRDREMEQDLFGPPLARGALQPRPGPSSMQKTEEDDKQASQASYAETPTEEKARGLYRIAGLREEQITSLIQTAREQWPQDRATGKRRKPRKKRNRQLKPRKKRPMSGAQLKLQEENMEVE